MRIWFGLRPAALARGALAFVIPMGIGVALGRAGTLQESANESMRPRSIVDDTESVASEGEDGRATTIDDILRHDPTAEVRDLRAGERVVLWQPQDHDQIIWGGGARVSLFVATDASWRHAGDVDSESDSSYVRIAFIDKVQGIAYLIEEFQGNGAPPSRAYAVAIVDARADSISAGTVGDVEDDGDHELRLWRRPARTGSYPAEPTRASRWIVHRTPNGLTSTEIGLTPWVDVLEAFCSGAHPEHATEEARTRVAQCQGGATFRWEGSAVIGELELALYCGDDTDARDVYGGLVLREDGRGWRVTDARGCAE